MGSILNKKGLMIVAHCNAANIIAINVFSAVEVDDDSNELDVNYYRFTYKDAVVWRNMYFEDCDAIDTMILEKMYLKQL